MAPDLLTVIVASVSCVVFCLVILILVVVFYRKHPPCCRTEHYTSDPPHYYSSRSVMGVTYNEHSVVMNPGATGQHLPARLFIIGKPNEYHMNGPLPQLPSYESVRRKDRQRQIHGMIAQRFGLSSCHVEPPPTYEETLRRSLDITPVDLHLDVHLPVHTQNESSNLCDDTHSNSQPSAALRCLASSSCSRFPSF